MTAVVEARGLTRTFQSPDGGEIHVLENIDLAITQLRHQWW